MKPIIIYTESLALKLQAKSLAKQLALPYTDHPHLDDLLLWLTPEFIGLKKLNEPHPFYINFLDKKIQFRSKQATLRNELLARALGLKRHTHPVIVDATAGLGRDSFMIATLGFEIVLLERSAIIHALLTDAMTRAQQNPAIARMHLIQTDAIQWLKQAQSIDVIYLDPMFPERKKTALVKKEMRLFQEVLGDDIDADLLFKTAITCGAKRVVVKRPKLAAPLMNMKPDIIFQGKSSRFDVYLPKNRRL